MTLKAKTKKTPRPATLAKATPVAKPAATRRPAGAVAKPAAGARVIAAAKSKPAAKPKPVSQSTKEVRSKVTSQVVKPVAVQPAMAKAADQMQKITFTYFAPQAGSVLVAGDFTKWEASPVSLVKEETGQWKTTVALKPGKYQYRLLVDGQWQNDPGCRELQPNEFGSANCVLSVAA